MKQWAINAAVRTFGPSAIRGAILGLSGWLLAKENLLAPFGIVSDAAARTTTIFWDQLSLAIVAALPAVVAGVIKMTQKEGTKVVEKITQPKGDVQ